MVSREHKRLGLHEKLQLLRSITNSHASNKASIIIDASKYIEELKQKVVRLNQEIACAQNNIKESPLPMVTVESLERGFLINVFSGKSFPGLLVAIWRLSKSWVSIYIVCNTGAYFSDYK
uniref:BHLH domain-containing protein n=1 Tax=Ananas comosus var. bracteatus TaxID=296719 RepID=A0A6V7PQF4_ANACO|nr:unnamed protein product [Ananas comosus var. bracteatus]